MALVPTVALAEGPWDFPLDRVAPVAGGSSSTSLAITGKSQLQSSTDGYFEMLNNAGTGFTVLRWGGTSAAFPMLKRSGTTLALRLADDSADAPFSVGTLTVTGQATLGSFTFVNSGNSNLFGLAIGNNAQQTRIVQLGNKLVGVVDNASSSSAFLIQGQHVTPATAAAPTALATTNSGTCWTNTGVAASTTQVFTLPTTPTVGYVACFEMVDAPASTTLGVAAGGADTIRIPGISGTLFTTLTTSTQYSVVRLHYAKSGIWVALSVVGTWAEN